MGKRGRIKLKIYRDQSTMHTLKSCDNQDENEPAIQENDVNESKQPQNVSPKSHRSSTSKMQRMRIDHSMTPRSPKIKRGQQSQTTDRLISEYNKNSLLIPKIDGLATDESYSQLAASMDLTNKIKDRNDDSLRNQQMNKYQRKFEIKSPKAKIEKSKLGQTLFPSN